MCFIRVGCWSWPVLLQILKGNVLRSSLIPRWFPSVSVLWEFLLNADIHCQSESLQSLKFNTSKKDSAFQCRQFWISKHHQDNELIFRTENKQLKVALLKRQRICYGADETWDMRIHMQAFIMRHGQNTGRVGQWQTGITQTRQRVILGQAWVDDRRTISRGLGRETIQENEQ